MNTIECRYTEVGVGKRLSNLYPHPFTLDDIRFGSIEGFLQSLKWQEPDEQAEIAKLAGYIAWKTGQKGNRWKNTQTLWWKGQAIDRHSDTYQALLERAYTACLEQNVDFQAALYESKGYELVHEGKHDPNDTVLTVEEYIGNLNRLRNIVLQVMDGV